MAKEISRRRFIAGVSAIATGSVAGCSTDTTQGEGTYPEDIYRGFKIGESGELVIQLASTETKNFGHIQRIGVLDEKGEAIDIQHIIPQQSQLTVQLDIQATTTLRVVAMAVNHVSGRGGGSEYELLLIANVETDGKSILNVSYERMRDPK